MALSEDVRQAQQWVGHAVRAKTRAEADHNEALRELAEAEERVLLTKSRLEDAEQKVVSAKAHLKDTTAKQTLQARLEQARKEQADALAAAQEDVGATAQRRLRAEQEELAANERLAILMGGGG